MFLFSNQVIIRSLSYMLRRLFFIHLSSVRSVISVLGEVFSLGNTETVSVLLMMSTTAVSPASNG